MAAGNETGCLRLATLHELGTGCVKLPLQAGRGRPAVGGSCRQCFPRTCAWQVRLQVGGQPPLPQMPNLIGTVPPPWRLLLLLLWRKASALAGLQSCTSIGGSI